MLVIAAFDPLSGTPYNALAISVAVGGVLVAIAAAIYARQAVFPGRRILRIQHSRGAPLVPPEGDAGLSVLVEVDNNVVDNPFITTVEILSSGRYDIRSEDFDQNAPLVIDLGRTATLVGVGSSAATRILAEGSFIRITPNLLKRSDALTFSAITEGEAERFSVSSPLIDTKVIVSTIENPVAGWRRVARMFLILGMLQSAALLFITYLFYSSSNRLLSTSEASSELFEELLKMCGIR